MDRRSFMKTGVLAGGAATLSAGLLATGATARAQQQTAHAAGSMQATPQSFVSSQRPN
jgi:hypothetical protein